MAVLRDLLDATLKWKLGNSDYRISNYFPEFNDSTKRTAAEVSAGVTPVNYAYAPGDARRYGFSTISTAAQNTLALNNAIFVASKDAAQQEVRIVDEGTYLVNKITARARVRLTASGWGVILKLADAANDHLLSWDETNNADDFELSYIKLDGNKLNQTTNGLGFVARGSRINIHHCFITNTFLAGVLITGDGTTTDDDCTVHNNLFYNCGADPEVIGGVGTPDPWGHCAGESVSRMSIHDNIFYSDDGFATYGPDIEPLSGGLSTNNSIRNNICVGCRIFYDSANTTAVSRSTGVTIKGNYVDARGSFGTQQANGAPIFVRYISGLDISGNTCYGDDNTSSPYSPYGGIYLDGCVNFSISGNTFFVTDVTGDEYGIIFDDVVADSSVGYIGENKFFNIGAGTYRYAIYALTADVTAVTYGRNYIIGTWASDAFNITEDASNTVPGIETTRRITVDFSTGGSLASGASRTVTVSSGFSCSQGDEVKACVVSGSIGSNNWNLDADVTNSNTICLTLINRDASSVTPSSTVDVRLVIRRYRFAGTAH